LQLKVRSQFAAAAFADEQDGFARPMVTTRRQSARNASGTFAEVHFKILISTGS